MEFTDELKPYVDALPENEQRYATELWKCLWDMLNVEWPEYTAHGLTFHRSLEIDGVLTHYNDVKNAEHQAGLVVMRINR